MYKLYIPRSIDKGPLSYICLKTPYVLLADINPTLSSKVSVSSSIPDSNNKMLSHDNKTLSSACIFSKNPCNQSLLPCTLNSSCLESSCNKSSFSDKCKTSINDLHCQSLQTVSQSNLLSALQMSTSSINLNTLHQIFGHPSSSILNQLLEIHDIQISKSSNPSFCEACQYDKQDIIYFPSSSTRALEPLSLIHTKL